MKKVFCGVSGTEDAGKTHFLSEVNVRNELTTALVSYYHADFSLRPAQEEALINQKLTERSENAIISTPTNSGKSLISYMLLLEEAISGKAVVLVEPLRALAYEKTEELSSIAGILKTQSGIKIDVRVTTGDYRLTDEFMHSIPVEKDGSARGQIIIATPERLDALSRNPDNMDWFRKISLVCFDEAHLIGDAHRGATLELLIAFLRSLDTKIRLVLMSATISNAEEIAAWISPCIVTSDVPRYPKLEKWVYSLNEAEKLDDILLSEVGAILSNPSNSVLIFVYKTASAEKLAHDFAEGLSGKKIKQHDLTAVESVGVAWFHSKMSAATKESVITAVTDGRIRLVVSTTALAMGINLPATHVFVRDISFSGFGDLDVSDLMQMIGRAGRGNKDGVGTVLLSGQNVSKENAIVEGLSNEIVPHVKSRLVPVVRESYYGAPQEDLVYISRVGNQVMGIINRYGKITRNGINTFLSNTLAGEQFESLPSILQKLSDWKLAFLDSDTNEYELTHLGKLSSRCYLPPLTAANVGQLFRDLLEDAPDGKHISQLSPIDFFIVLCLVSDENLLKPRYGKALVSKVHGYMESLPLEEKSYLYRTWISPSPENLYGSARVDGSSNEAARRVYQSTFTAMLLYDISRGYSSSQLQRDYQVDVDELQEKLRDNAIWILCGLEQLLEVKSFYYHLKENCHAEPEQIQQVDDAFCRASHLIFALVANLKFRSKLGELVRGIKRVYPHAESYPGEGTLRKLEEAGIVSIKDLVGKTANDLVDLGIRESYAILITGYIQKRLA